MNIGDKIKELRKQRKYTQEQLAEYLDISSQAVSKWETGGACPDVDMLVRLAIFFNTSVDALLDFDKSKHDMEINRIVKESVHLRTEPKKAEAFYRKALESYPNNEILLNCLLMVIDDSTERIKIGEQLLECTNDDEIKYDVIRLLAQTYHGIGEKAMARYYVNRLPELYFSKTEIEAVVSEGKEQEAAITVTEQVCMGTLINMLALRLERADLADEKERLMTIEKQFLEIYGPSKETKEVAGRCLEALEQGSCMGFYK